MVIDVVKGEQAPILSASANPLKLEACGWSAADRLVCELYGITSVDAQRLSFTRLIGVDANGAHQMPLGRKTDDRSLGINQYDGMIVDWMAGTDGNILMARNFVPHESTGTMMSVSAKGLGVERVDTKTGAGRLIETPKDAAVAYYSDGNGTVRIIALEEHANTQMLTGTTTYRYRTLGSRDWAAFSRVEANGPGLRPLAVDGTANIAYALGKKDGRDALYRVTLDGTLETELIYADPKVDVGDVVTVGRRGRVIGFTYVTDQRNVVYLDPEYRKLAVQLSKTLPDLPLVDFADTSADESKVIVHAASPTDPGRFYLLDRSTHKMIEISPGRPALAGYTFGTVKAISYPAADGTLIPAYLTLPPGSDGKGLPALVMPHGGPAYRDTGGFDYLAQFFAQRGFAVIQPEYRGSIGYGDAFYNKNGFRSWHTAISDVTDAGRWLVGQGIADPEKLAIFGWSYGGYAALQSNVLDPRLFKAVVAVAPVTDLDMIKDEARGFTNYDLVQREVGDEKTATEASPLRHTAAFQAPVLMFHGDNDLNVSIAESRAMDAALRRAGKRSRLVIYPGLDHQLDDSKAEADMLAQSDLFLRAALKIGQPEPSRP
ncbi:prolyl oligopeptidase family serine peptidase (plasmid) [Polymorphobacter sp. PAMC 29334]|uniref:alpha/beta hydrolase family protein n=1 Tax=Polymorphobacter sp. PAMC 29334 TaxID=2862331 RepID=UPI001C76517B|nr:alpha/beta fold hydrolase [Polymorphobacter sp. PAMC 29334]QYE32957.1 prolyl oligopeptidase family serine peptidase [Polymorphobacter sp. PAMC 29334]